MLKIVTILPLLRVNGSGNHILHIKKSRLCFNSEALLHYPRKTFPLVRNNKQAHTTTN